MITIVYLYVKSITKINVIWCRNTTWKKYNKSRELLALIEPIGGLLEFFSKFQNDRFYCIMFLNNHAKFKGNP